MASIIFIKVRQTTYAVRFETLLYMEKKARQITVHLTEGEDIRFYGKYYEVIREVVRYLNNPRCGVKVHLDDPNSEGPYSL